MANVRPSLRTTRKRADTLIRAGKLAEARALYTSICKESPSDIDLWLALASLNRRLGFYHESEQCARQALSIQPDSVNALVEYGASLQYQGRSNEAIAIYRKALDYNPDCGEAHYFLATACLEQGLIEPAINHYRRTIEIYPAHIQALNNLSAILTNQGIIQESLELLERALTLQPNAYHMLINLARLHVFTGNSGEALEILKRVTRVYPNSAEAHSKYLLCTNYQPQPDPQKLYDEHVRWGELHTKNIKCYTTYENPIGAERPLRIGYVSPDLRNHSVAYFIEPILTHHDRKKFSISCYADVAKPDDTSRRLASHCDHWCWTSKMSDDQLCEKIRADRIDILVDLAGHTANNRLPVFARKPSPLAVSYLGYPNTTGLSAIAYRLTDSIADPPDVADRYHTEKLLRLADGFLCYRPPETAPDIASPPSLASTGVVFGSFNNLAKVTPEVIHAWSRILDGVKNSRLLLKSKATADPFTRSRLIKLFSEQGTDQSRLILLGPAGDSTEHLRMYNQVDIALDTFPYNGTTTTCEALWMGVPVITLKGTVHASRVGASLLDRLDLDHLISKDSDDYIQTAIQLAGQPDQLVKLRRELRDRMAQSTLCDAGLLTGNIEDAYANIWHVYGKNICQ